MVKGEAVLIEKAANGFIVNPKEISNLTKSEKDVYVFETFEGLQRFLGEHFVSESKDKNG